MTEQVARLLIAALTLAAEQGINYRRLAADFERIRDEGREPNEDELLASLERREDRLAAARDSVEGS
jgi:hypothetical protein